METWTKLYQRIITSSVWKQPSDIRVVWITMLALKDKDGIVMGTVGWLADQARVSDEACRMALKIFESPDERSRTSTYEGRKIEAIPGGWKVLNHNYYRDGIEDQRDKWRRQKATQRMKNTNKPLPGENEYVARLEQGAPQEELDRISAP